MVGERHLTQPRHVPATDQSHIRDGVGRAVAFNSTPLGTSWGMWQKKIAGRVSSLIARLIQKPDGQIWVARLAGGRAAASTQ